MSEKGEGLGEKESSAVNPKHFTELQLTPFAHEREAMVQFEWLLARQ